ncbi:S1C family serine protease [Listeria ilorinensis]|uniref:S1C family serine protease n=1 Tax=Listeria ilorinensis TaxID=2867439 RepID=UPI001EF4C8C5|nr:trypsin-like peptidase domain-containing protein [Listeria ilorinensis]
MEQLENNEFEKKKNTDSAEQPYQPTHDGPVPNVNETHSERAPHPQEPVQEPIAEGVTPEGQAFAGATQEQAEASMTNAFFEKAASSNEGQPVHPGTRSGGGGTIPPEGPQITTGGSGNGGEPPRKNHSKRNNMIGYFVIGLVGVLIGALVVFFAVSGFGDTSNSSGSSSDVPVKKAKVSYENSTDITKAVDKVQDAVVSVLNYQQGTSLTGETSEEEASSGSGVVYKKEDGKAYIVTNNHVVEGANKLEVTFSSGKKSEAKLLGTDEWNDLAVLQIDDENVTTVAEFGDSDSLTVGETAIAIGSPLGTEFAGTVTQGIISGLNRTVPVDVNGDGSEDWEAEVIQTDAAINPGNSGGALINLEGQVIGINSMKISTEDVEGIGFAIPINTVAPILAQLEANGEVVRPSLGVTLRDVDTIPETQQKNILNLPDGVDYGAMVSSVQQGSAADEAGLKQYDVIVEMNGKKVSDSMGLRKILYSSDLKIGDKVDVKYYRDGKEQTTTITLKAANTSAQ